MMNDVLPPSAARMPASPPARPCCPRPHPAADATLFGPSPAADIHRRPSSLPALAPPPPLPREESNPQNACCCCSPPAPALALSTTYIIPSSVISWGASSPGTAALLARSAAAWSSANISRLSPVLNCFVCTRKSRR